MTMRNDVLDLKVVSSLCLVMPVRELEVVRDVPNEVRCRGDLKLMIRLSRLDHHQQSEIQLEVKLPYVRTRESQYSGLKEAFASACHFV